MIISQLAACLVQMAGDQQGDNFLGFILETAASLREVEVLLLRTASKETVYIPL